MLTIQNFCDRYAVSRSTVYRLVAAGDIPLVKIGRASRIKLEDADRWALSLPGYTDRSDAA
ncbi:MAG: helix-turn-helix domain-containing protein [Sphingomonadales bacterium]|nr:helix-turn-helix domain-containing protein [Sphingomonadales bacterium]